MPVEKNVTNLPRILVVDDEAAIQRFLRTALDTGEFSLHQAENGHAALAAAVAVKPDVILLDLGLPDMDGVEVIRRVREWSQVPIIVLSVRDREDDKVQALDAGADDYLAKPFGVAELVARIRVVLRRSLQQVPEPVFRLGELEVDLPRRRVSVAGANPGGLTPILRGKVLQTAPSTREYSSARGTSYTQERRGGSHRMPTRYGTYGFWPAVCDRFSRRRSIT